MSAIESQLFYNRFTGTGGGGISNLAVGVGGAVRVIESVFFYRAIESVRFLFTASDKTIYILDDSEGQSFSNAGFKVDYTITVDGSASNDGDFTIESISYDGRTITVAETVVDETIESCSIYDTTPVTDINLLYNLIENSDAPTYYSKTDADTQQVYTIGNLDASDTIHETSFRVLTKSRGWVTNEIDNDDTGETSEVTIIGGGITNFRQYFTIEHNFKVAPFYTVDQYNNFLNGTPPDYYKGAHSLKYITRIEARYDPTNPEPDNIAEKTDEPGTGSWYGEANFGRKPEFYSTDITYGIGGDSVTELDVSQDVLVDITFKSVSGLFVNAATRCILQFNTCSNDDTDYQNTDTTLLQNQFIDTATALLGGAPVNGTQFGTGYQAITQATFTYVDAFTATVSFTFSAGTILEQCWQSKEDNDRFYLIGLYSDDSTNTTSKQSISNPVKADFNTAAWNKTDDTLLEIVGSGVYNYSYPDDGVYGVGDLNSDEGDQWIQKINFRVYNDPDADLNTPTIKSVKFQVLAYKTDRADFILEEKVIDCTGFRKLDYVQQLDVEQSRGFISYDDDPRNLVVLIPNSDYDTATQAGYTFSYGLIARYEDWISAFNAQKLMAGGTNEVPDVAKDIDSLTQKWANYSGVNGWALKTKITIAITGTNGYDNPFVISSNMTVKAADDITWSGIGGGATQEIQYFEEDGTTETGTVVKMGVTLIRTTWTGDFPEPPTGSGYYASMLAVLNNSGSIFDQRFASSEIESEDSSPWSPTDADPMATTSYANGNLRINIYETLGTVTSINVEGYFDSRYLIETDEKVHIIPRLGPKYIST